MRRCGCPCQTCEQTTVSVCNLFPGFFNNSDFGDAIFLGGEENGVFKLLIRRLNDNLQFLSSQPFVWFTICIPMNGDLGTYHFMSDSGKDCYAFIKRAICGVNTHYYFWIGKTDSIVDIPFDTVNKNDYISLYGYPNVVNQTVISYIPKYYLLRIKKPGDSFTRDSGGGSVGFAIPPSMNYLELPYIFWAFPKKYSIEVKFSGNLIGGWCDNRYFPYPYIETVNYNYSNFDGTYLITVGGQSVETSKYWRSGFYDSSLVKVGEVFNCRNFSGLFKEDIVIAMEIIIGDGLSLSITNHSPFLNLGGASTSYDFSIFKDKLGPENNPILCVDDKIVTGQYGECIQTSTSVINNAHGCPATPDEIYNGNCGISMTFSSIGATAKVTVIEWELKFGCQF